MRSLLDLLQGKQQDQEQMMSPMEPQQMSEPVQAEPVEEPEPEATQLPEPVQIAPVQPVVQTESQQADRESIGNFLQNPIGRELGDERQFPFRPGSEPTEQVVKPDRPLVKEEKAEIKEDLSGAKKIEENQNKNVKDLPPGPEKDAKKDLLDELKKARLEANQAIKDGRSADNIRELLNGLASGYSKINLGIGMNAAQSADIQGVAPTQLALRKGNEAMQDSQARIKAIMDEIGNLRALEADAENNKLKQARIKALQEKETEAKPKSEFQKQQEKDLGKASSEYYTLDRPNLTNNLIKVEDALDIMNQSDDFSGFAVANMGDTLRKAFKPDAQIIKDRMDSAIQDTLRPTLGAQFTENEGERIKKLAYDIELPPEENRKRASMLANYIKQKTAANDALYQHIEQGGSLSNFDKSIFDNANQVLREAEKATQRDLVRGGQTHTIDPVTGRTVKLPSEGALNINGKTYRVGDTVRVKGVTYVVSDEKGNLEEVK